MPERLKNPSPHGLQFFQWLLVLALIWISTSATAAPTITVTHDDWVIDRSCQIKIPLGTVIRDSNTNGVIQIAADGITIEFARGTELCGAPAQTPWDELSGIGIRLNGHHGVTVRNARVHGFKNGVVISDAFSVTIEGGDFSDNYRQHLRSTRASSDDADWLFPHHNDETKWRDEYGGALCVENSENIQVRGIKVRRGQNGIVLDRVNHSRFYDNDCSFLSGWGIALWRSSSNIISRNALDFCIRGHSEGVYNRGCDSAGILCFEQSSRNLFSENSVTHGGDGFFGFAGQEAIGETWMNAERTRLRAQTGKENVDDLIQAPAELVARLSDTGCNDNVLIGNDFSYASAHGIEMTFSKRNQYINNRIVENAICGFWGGYSSESRIEANHFEDNGGMAYGLERGGINMEHAANNQIVDNQFINNRCGLHFWWNDSPLLKYPGIVGGPTDVTGNVITGNRFVIDEYHPFKDLSANKKLYVLQIRGGQSGHVHDNQYFRNTVAITEPHAQELALEPGCDPVRTGTSRRWELSPNAQQNDQQFPHPLGHNHPVGARPRLQGRTQIVLNEWGPWDHQAPLLRLGAASPEGEQIWELFGVPKLSKMEVLSGQVTLRQENSAPDHPLLIKLKAGAGVTPYRVRLSAPRFEHEISGSILTTRWQVTFFNSSIDPMITPNEWRKLAESPDALHWETSQLNFPFGMGGPRDLNLSPELTSRGPGPDHFGMIAHTVVPLPVGRWRIITVSDDGVRVVVNGRTLIENWNIHGGAGNEAVVEQKEESPVDIVVEYFERDGAAVFKLGIEKL